MELAIFIFFVMIISYEMCRRLFAVNIESYENNKKYGTAEVVGYREERGSDSSFVVYKLSVKIEQLNGKVYECSVNEQGDGLEKIYPIGTIIDVVYWERKIWGIKSISVFINDSDIVSKLIKTHTIFANIFKWLEILSFIVLIILIAMYVLN